MRPCQPGRIRGGHAGEGSERTALAHPTCVPAPAAAGAGRVRGESQLVCPCGVPPHPTRLVPKTIFNPLTTQPKLVTKF